MKILIAVDDSPQAARAARFVAGMRWPAGSRVIVATVVRPATPLQGMPGGAEDADAIAGLHQRFSCALHRARDLLRAAGLSTEERVVQGDARERLLELVEAERVDLLVLGSRGHSRLLRLLLGSVSSHAVTHARCSVLVMKGNRRGSGVGG
jgi:nucleotide-binding universal stress UspA family protein